MMDNFWQSENNKRKLITAAHKYYIENSGRYAFDQNGYNYPAKHCSATYVNTLKELQEFPQQAEADMRIILHIYWALSGSLDTIIIFSNDTVVLSANPSLCISFPIDGNESNIYKNRKC